MLTQAECTAMLTQTKDALCDYLLGLDSSLIQGQSLTVKNVLAVIDQLTAPEVKQEASSGYLSMLLSPVTLLASAVSKVGNGLYGTLYKQLSSDRKAQLRALSETIQQLEVQYGKILACTGGEELAETKGAVVSALSELYSMMAWLCENSDYDNKSFSINGEQVHLKGLKHHRTKNSALAGFLTRKVLEAYSLDSLTESVEALCDSRSALITQVQSAVADKDNLRETLSVQLVRKELLVRLQQMQLEEERAKSEKGQSDLVVLSKFATSKSRELAKHKKVAEKNQRYIQDRKFRERQYANLEKSLVTFKLQKGAKKHPIVAAIKRNSPLSVAKHIADGCPLDNPKVQAALTSEACNNNAKKVLNVAQVYNVHTLFSLLQAATECSAAVKYLQSFAEGKICIEAIKPYFWLQKITVIIFQPDQDHQDIVREIKSKTTKDIDSAIEGLEAIMDLDDTEKVQPNQVLLAEIAGFLRECIEHVKMVQNANDRMMLPFAEHTLLKALMLKMKGLLPQMKQLLTPSVETTQDAMTLK